MSNTQKAVETILVRLTQLGALKDGADTAVELLMDELATAARVLSATPYTDDSVDIAVLCAVLGVPEPEEVDADA